MTRSRVPADLSLQRERLPASMRILDPNRPAHPLLRRSQGAGNLVIEAVVGVEIGAQIAKVRGNLSGRNPQESRSISAPRQIAAHKLPAKDDASGRLDCRVMLSKRSLCIPRSRRGALHLCSSGKERSRSHEQKGDVGLRMRGRGAKKNRREKHKRRQSGHNRNKTEL